MRRRVVIPILLLAAALLARRRRRGRSTATPLPDTRRDTPVASLPPASRFVSVPWTLVEAPADPRLTIDFTGDEHMQLDRVDAQETPTQVFVTVLMRWSPPAGDWFAQARRHEAIVALSTPLGERELVHAPVDDEPSRPPLYP